MKRLYELRKLKIEELNSKEFLSIPVVSEICSEAIDLVTDICQCCPSKTIECSFPKIKAIVKADIKKNFDIIYLKKQIVFYLEKLAELEEIIDKHLFSNMNNDIYNYDIKEEKLIITLNCAINLIISLIAEYTFNCKKF